MTHAQNHIALVSWQATIWAASLPHSRVGHVPFRVLMLLADHAHDDGSASYRSVSSMAHTLEVSERTIKRALGDLRAEGLIVEGDQRIVNHLPGGKRPTVYNLSLPTVRTLQGELLTGVTEMSPVTSVVPDKRKNPPLTTTKTSRDNHTADVTPSADVCRHDKIPGDGRCVFACKADFEARKSA